MPEDPAPHLSSRASLLARLRPLPEGRLVAWARGRADLNDLAAKLEEASHNLPRQLQIAADWLKWRDDLSALLDDLEGFGPSTPASSPAPDVSPSRGSTTAFDPTLQARIDLESYLVRALSGAELRQVAAHLGLGADLPDGSATTTRALAHELVSLLVRRGVVDPAFFQRLLPFSEGRREELSDLAQRFGVTLLVPRASASPPSPLQHAPDHEARSHTASTAQAAPTSDTEPRRPRVRRSLAWTAGLAVVIALSLAFWRAWRPPAPPRLPLTVVLRGRDPLGELLSALAARGAWGVVIDDTLDAATLEADRGGLEEGLKQLNALGVPVIATSAGEADQVPVCGTPPCLDGVIVPMSQLDPVHSAEPRALGPRFDACAHGEPTAPLAIELLLRRTAGAGLPPDWRHAWCRTRVEVLAPPAEPDHRPWCVLTAAALMVAPKAACAAGDPVEGRVILIGSPDADVPRFTLEGSSTGTLTRAEVLAALAWSLEQR